MNRFIAYLEDTLHIAADVSQYSHTATLPLYLRNGYDLYTLAVNDVRCLLAIPREQSNLSNLRKQCGQLKKLTGLDCVLCLEKARAYTKEKMLSEGIPFIIAGQQIYMPFLGIALARSGAREMPHTEQISFATQRLLLTAIYQRWSRRTLTEASKELDVSKMTVTRCFDELQALGLPLIKTEGKMRLFLWSGGRRALWDTVRHFLRNPVARQYRFGERLDVGHAKLGDISAISHYSMLADSPCTVYAISKADAKTLDLSAFPLIPEGEAPGMIVQIMAYGLDYGNNAAVDPLTATLSLAEADLHDPRVEAAIDEILEDCLHD